MAKSIAEAVGSVERLRKHRHRIGVVAHRHTGTAVHIQRQSIVTSHTAINPTAVGTPKYFEFLREPAFSVWIALRNNRSEEIFERFIDSVKNRQAEYTPILGWHNCLAELNFISVGEFSDEQNGEFETKGFVVAGSKPKLSGMFRIGFDKMPTFQNDDFWNLPDKYVNIIYPEYPNSITVEGNYFVYNDGNKTEKLCLI